MGTLEQSTMTLPQYELRAIRRGDVIPAEAEELFARQLANVRTQEAADREGDWSFLLTLAVTPQGHVLGGVHLDLGPIGGGGPLGLERIAYLERTLVRPEYRRRGLATKLLAGAIGAAKGAGCWYVRCSNNWDNPAERALFLRCGFVLVDNNDEDPGSEPCYQAIRVLR
jgi:GNAT superfamily N-acetyltransferase